MKLIKGITIEIKGKDMVLDISEARELYQELNFIFGCSNFSAITPTFGGGSGIPIPNTSGLIFTSEHDPNSSANPILKRI